MSTPPPNPYGQPPPNPYGPYGQPPQYPQQYPQQYGQQYPQQGQTQGYGGWPTPPPLPPQPKKNQGPKIALITLASIAGLLALSWFGNNIVSGSDGGSDDSFPAAEYQLTRPQTLLGGKYKLSDDQSAERQGQLAGTSEANIRDPKASVAQYVSTSEAGVLVISGMHGRIKDADEARSRILKGAGESDGSTIAVPAKDFTPAGSDVTITCQVLTTEQTDGSGNSTLPMCAWADENTTTAVALTTVETSKQSPEEVDLKAVAEATAKIREETRKPIG
ncbi:hypothetical protein ACIHCQ_22550 [Streptomyces sp. NPDC052236]|uniref:hypothetical protein n=1 Tax=Streptomyces sp. NPDC052236 TaxID=3365686 RepID=UPI0037D42095